MRALLIALIIASVAFTGASGCRTASSGCSSCGK